MAKKIFQTSKNGGRPISLDTASAEAITNLGGDDYLVTINGNNHRIHAPGTNVGELHGAAKGRGSEGASQE